MLKKSLISSVIGTALEHYDLALYGPYAFLIAQKFFPPDKAYYSLLVFCLALIGRPLGGIIFGYIGDKFGRRRALGLSLNLMAIPSLIIILLPSYEKIGLFAAFTIVLVRLFQGMSAGGEYNGAGVFAIENQPSRKGLVSGLISGSAILGCVLATSAYTVFGDAHWKIPFLIGAMIAFAGSFIRRGLSENYTETDRKRFNYKTLFTEHFGSILKIFIFGGQSFSLGYLLFISMPHILRHQNYFNNTEISILNSIGLLTFALSAILAGFLSDHIKRKSPFMLLSAGFTLLFVGHIKAMGLVENFYWAMLAHMILGLLSGLHQGVQHVCYVDLFPKSFRYSGISMGYSLGGALIGGLCTMFSGTDIQLYILRLTSLFVIFILLKSYCVGSEQNEVVVS